MNPESMVDVFGWLTKNLAPGARVPGRLARMASFFVNGRAFMKEAFAAHCEAGEMLARRLGFTPDVQATVRDLWERWDGKGFAYGLKGAQTPTAARVLHLAQVIEVAHRFGGSEAATTLAKDRRGKDFEPELVGIFLKESQGSELWGPLAKESVQEDVLSLRPPSPFDEATPERIDSLCAALADFIDIKTRQTWGHSPAVAEAAAGIARRLGLPQVDIDRLRLAALVHDLGKVYVPCSVMEKEDHLTADDTERVHLHPYYTDRILSRAGRLKDLAPLASVDHEWVDGQGYHRRLAGAQITSSGKALAVADAYVSLAAHPRENAGPEEALGRISQAAGTRFDRECYDALVAYVNGEPEGGRRRRRPQPGNLSEREQEILRHLARGLGNRQIAEALIISEKTVEHHLGHIYTKLNVTCRTSAVVFAVQNGLAD